MRYALELHPSSPCKAVTEIDVEITQPSPDQLELHYFVTGKTSDLRLPPRVAPTRGHELWQHTCFEVFIRPAPSDAYYEFNFSPSSAWAAYHFTNYRQGMSLASGMDVVGNMAPPLIEVTPHDAGFELRASLILDQLPDLLESAKWHLGVAAVIEQVSGNKSYWALAHPPGKADFHQARCFIHELERAEPR